MFKSLLNRWKLEKLLPVGFAEWLGVSMFKIPNAVMFTDAQNDRLRQLFSVVEDSAEFKDIERFSWSVFQAEILSNSELSRTMIEPALRYHLDWAIPLQNAIASFPSVVVIGVVVEDRRGLEHLPRHVFGKSVKFVVDESALRILYVMRGVVST